MDALDRLLLTSSLPHHHPSFASQREANPHAIMPGQQRALRVMDHQPGTLSSQDHASTGRTPPPTHLPSSYPAPAPPRRNSLTPGRPPCSGANDNRHIPLRQPSMRPKPAQDTTQWTTGQASPSLPEDGDSHLAAAPSRIARDARPMQANAAASLITMNEITSVASQSQAKGENPGEASQPASPTQTWSVCNSNGIFLSLFFRSAARQTKQAKQTKKDNKCGLFPRPPASWYLLPISPVLGPVRFEPGPRIHP